MKTSEILKEMPHTIPALDRHGIQVATNTCLQNIDSAIEIEKLGKTTSLYHYGSGDVGYYFVYDSSLPSKERVGYFVQYHAVEFDKKLALSKAVRQVLVWRNSTNIYVAEISKKVFWELLWPKYKCLASDSQQTDQGQKFWFTAVGSALSKGLTVRIINTNDSTFVDTTTKDEFNKQVSTTWGTTKWFQRMIIVIFE